jgi:hypothetical protein
MAMSPATSACARCGAPFACGRDDPAGCWCVRMPSVPAERVDPAATCLCEACLRGLLAAGDGSQTDR